MNNKVFLACILLIEIGTPPEPGCSSPEYVFDKDAVIAYAEENSPELNLEKLTLEAAIQAWKMDFRQFLPSIEIGISQDDSVILGNPDSRARRLTLSLTQPLFNGGRALLARKLSRSELFLEQRRISSRELEISDTVWDIYHQILVSEEKKRLQRETVALIAEQLGITNTEHEMGMITDLDLLEAQLELRNLEIVLQKTELALAELHFNLKQILGMPIHNAVRVEGSIKPFYKTPSIELSPEFIIDLGRKNNLSLVSSEYQVNKTEMELKSQRLRFLPSVEVKASIFFEGETFPLHDPGFNLRVSLSFPHSRFPLETSFYGGKRGDSQVSRGYSAETSFPDNITLGVVRDQQAITLKAVRLQLENTLNSMEFDIYRNLNLHSNQRKQIELEMNTLELYTKRIAILKKQLESGELRRVQYVQAQIELAKKETALLEEILHLTKLERNIEKLAGLRPGELRWYNTLMGDSNEQVF